MTRYNLRKFSELPFQLVRCYRYKDLYDHVLFNYKWLYAKMCALPLNEVLSDFEDAVNNIADPQDKKEINLVADSIRLGGAILKYYPEMLASQLNGRLLPERTKESCGNINGCRNMHISNKNSYGLIFFTRSRSPATSGHCYSSATRRASTRTRWSRPSTACTPRAALSNTAWRDTSSAYSASNSPATTDTSCQSRIRQYSTIPLCVGKSQDATRTSKCLYRSCALRSTSRYS